MGEGGVKWDAGVDWELWRTRRWGAGEGGVQVRVGGWAREV